MEAYFKYRLYRNKKMTSDFYNVYTLIKEND